MHFEIFMSGQLHLQPEFKYMHQHAEIRPYVPTGATRHDDDDEHADITVTKQESGALQILQLLSTSSIIYVWGTINNSR